MSESVEIIVQDGPLRVLYAPGRNDTLVVSCSGVGSKRKVAPPPEFPTMASRNGENHVLFVIDESRSWLNAPGMAERLVTTIEDVRNQIGATRLVGLGNSMGATMVLLLSRMIDFDTVLAFTPQYSVDPCIVPEETRWRPLRREIKNFRFPSVEGLRPERTTYFILHGDAPDELIHALRFPEQHGVTYLILPRHGHRLAAQLKKVNALSAIVNLAITGRHYRLRKKLTRLGAKPRFVFKAEQGGRAIPSIDSAA